MGASSSHRPSNRLEGRVHTLAPKPEFGVRLFGIDPAEAQALAGLELADAADVERADRRDLRVPPGGLPVDEQDDRLAITDDLDAAQRHAVRDDVVPADVLDHGAAEPRPHPVALRRHLVWLA